MIKRILTIVLLCVSLSIAQDNSSNKNNNSSISISSLPISVTIGGDFVVNGSFVAYASQRLDNFITQIFNKTKMEALSVSGEPEYAAQLLKELNKYSLENITLKRADGTELKINLEQFRKDGDFKNNPYLKNDDVIIFPTSGNISNGILISVTIGGEFIVNGTFDALPAQRVDHFITKVFNEAKEKTLSVTNEYEYSLRLLDELNEYSQRNILIKRSDGSELKVDLEKFRLTGDFSCNPYLNDEDIIIFPKKNIEKDFISIAGAVKRPITFQFSEGDKLSDALMFALGLSESYENVNKAEISRLSYDGQTEERILVNLDASFDLQRGDRIRIIGKEIFKESYKVLVSGEVNNPGYIYITKNSSTVNEVISKSGGFTESAWLKKVQLISGKNAELLFNKKDLLEKGLTEFERTLELENNMMGRLSNIGEEDTLYFNIENELRIYNGGTILDFSDSMDIKRKNLIVNNGDVIVVPKFENVVNIFGQVPKTGKYEYAEGKDYMYYINLAGGFGDLAEDGEVMLIKGNNRNWIQADDSDTIIEPGDYLWIPKEPIRNFDFYLARVSNIAGIFGTIATLILLFSQLGK
ncbi:MAG: SLBB domain-containing protein [Bacteroidetes bacterium]|nr:SLBB domain-containing protein [Bacteroidota bacterium]